MLHLHTVYGQVWKFHTIIPSYHHTMIPFTYRVWARVEVSSASKQGYQWNVANAGQIGRWYAAAMPSNYGYQLQIKLATCLMISEYTFNT
jgi:hypothetical protein